jgi:hypothetical protein
MKIATPILLTTLALLLSACGASIDEYKNLSQAGQLYSDALERLLIKSGQITIDRTSEDLLVEDISPSNITIKRYGASSRQDKLNLASLQRIITQVRLLKSYFKQLEILANSDSPATASLRATNIGNNIAKLSGTMKIQDVLLKNFAPSVVRISISANLRQALRTELSIRGKTVLEALEIQETLVGILRETINSNTSAIAESREIRYVVPPITSTTEIGNPEAWIKLRRDTLTYNQTVNELAEASESLTEFKSLFKAVLEDKVTSARIESFLKETDDFIKLVEKNKPKDIRK